MTKLRFSTCLSLFTYSVSLYMSPHCYLLHVSEKTCFIPYNIHTNTHMLTSIHTVLQVFPHVLWLCEPGLCATDSTQNTQLAAKVPLLSLVSLHLSLLLVSLCFYHWKVCDFYLVMNLFLDKLSMWAKVT